MKKSFVAVVLCIALLSSFTVSASAEFSSSDSSNLAEIKKQVQAIRDQLGYPPGGFSSLRDAVNHIANNLPSSPKDYSTTLANIYKNTSSIDSALDAISGDTHSISAAIPSITQYLNNINSNIGTAQIAITNHIDSASSLNHDDLTSIFSYFNSKPSVVFSPDSEHPFFLGRDEGFNARYGNFTGSFGLLIRNLMPVSSSTFSPSLYDVIHQLQLVLASDDDLQLKQDNKANEDAATDAFVNGSSSQTSLGTDDIGNLKDIGGSFNDLASLNGQSSVTSFLNGLTSADGTGQGWFSEATRASLDAVSAPVTTSRLVHKTWRGEKALVATVSDDSSVNLVDSPAPAADSDPYNMSGFEDNYNWIWGDAS